MTETVVDASALILALVDHGAGGTLARRRLRQRALVAPELIDLEVASALRRLVAAGILANRLAQLALADLADMPIRRVPHSPLLTRIWSLRNNLTVYDAAYVALAELVGGPLLTADARLARSPDISCEVDLLTL